MARFFLSKRKKNLAGTLSGKVLAEKPGFEPGRQLPAPYSLSRGAPSATWVLLHSDDLSDKLYPIGYWRRERDSNPRCLSASLVFKTSAFNRSAISPRRGTSERYYNSFRPARQSSFFKKYGFSEILSLNGGKRKQEPHEMRPCLKRQPSKAQGFSAAAVL